MPNARDTALFLTLPSSRICSRSASRDNGRHRFKRARLPLFHFSQHFIGEGRNEIRRDFKSVQLEQMPANLTHAHPTCIHADHMILKARQAPLIFGNERRLKRGKPVSWNIQRSITRRRDHGLRAAAVAVIVGFPLALCCFKWWLSSASSIRSANCFFSWPARPDSPNSDSASLLCTWLSNGSIRSSENILLL